MTYPPPPTTPPTPQIGYTYYSQRSKTSRQNNSGWRLDYMLASRQLAARVHDSYILPTVEGEC
jgi:exodeoxyribonuclease-3